MTAEQEATGDRTLLKLGPVSVPTYCRICVPQCGLLVEVKDGQIAGVRPDKQNPLSRGYSCPKGRNSGRLHTSEDRLLSSQRRTAGGTLEAVPIGAATADCRTLVPHRRTPRPELSWCTPCRSSYFAVLTRPSINAWLRALGSSKLFSASTIDQSAKQVATMRMGRVESGLQDMASSDVMLLAGTNPLISHIGGHDGAFPICDPLARLREAKKRGMKLIVIDPRRTETARYADLHLQPLPGEDSILFAAMINIIISERLYDADFCRRHVNGLDDLAARVREATPALAAQRTGLSTEEIVQAARMFGTARRGGALTGTGPDMGPRSNLAEHLVSCLNTICGRYLRAGDQDPNPGVFRPLVRREQISPPRHEWDFSYKSRIGGTGQIMGELPSGILADEILVPGEDQIRALVVVGGNPAVCLPDQVHAVEALRSLELLVTVDPFVSETGRLADYIIAPAMPYERADCTIVFEGLYPGPFAQYTEPIIAKPSGVVEEWEFFWDLATRMDIPMTPVSLVTGGASGSASRLADDPLEPVLSNMEEAVRPSSEDLIKLMTSGSRIPLEEIRSHVHGAFYWPEDAVVKKGLLEAADRRLELIPADVDADLTHAIEVSVPREGRAFLLVVRRMKEVLNSYGRRLEGLSPQPYNPAYMNPSDIESLGCVSGEMFRLESDHGSIGQSSKATQTCAKVWFP